MTKICFDHEKLRAYQDALRFVAFADPIITALPGKLAARGSALECAACLDVLVVKRHVEATLANDGKEILRGIVSMLVGLLDTFGAQVHEDQTPYQSGSELPAAVVDHE